MVIVYEILVAVALAGVLTMAYTLWRRHGGSRPLGITGAVLALLAYCWPWLLAANWAQVLRAALGFAVVAALGLGYGYLIARARRAARRREEARDR